MHTTTPRLIRWDITSKCNLSCSHCCVADNIKDDSIKDISSEELTSTLRKVASSGVEAIHFLGGEPTIRKDFLDLLRIADESGLIVSFNTNGIRQDKRYIEGIFAHNVHKVVVSIDGPDEQSHEAVRGSHTFQKTIRFIRELLNLRRKLSLDRPLLQIQAVLTAAWAHKIREMVNLCIELEVDGLKINHLSEHGNAITNIDSLFVDYPTHFFALLDILDCMNEYPNLRIDAPIRARVIQYHRRHRDFKITPDPYSCPAVYDNVYVGPSGEIAPCQLAQSQGMGSNLPVNNILRDKPENLWNSEYFEHFVQSVHNQNIADKYRHQIPCNRCPFIGSVCNPCPLPAKPGIYPTNYMCLIATELLYIEDKTNHISREFIEKEIARIVRENPARAINSLGT